ncbi:50S ribosomal protein L28 [Moorella thermoacetica]|uniref:Large ribosomal subunit protein bL28 n=2 Tax=Neomoorella thermoacetica TaxID=1525 RepID=RL28_MOOTA|nr:50S ribosomal protein L28 [Moorella thermoacetica]Q2RK02.1 RecName: Full=Large ribosomal subunit protein bL28; AltName: Full=50S ribosomal protein L28 [Moorella thermoacetica ATCC 39073]AKX93675.1 50S ribosomal protein L28 [Moorella thermoacetica]AKX96317.1 50S ribosomal protein L28 [Moorella thermoacetica]AOQ23586.1 50S ribosomal protein L28 [Moorella thermoacetica]APC08040.1 50S ribosomal protein L28 [Moorella thermoacetica]OIQ09675.1 50S ribosomal protein L28 [Moorella thermoacetica]
MATCSICGKRAVTGNQVSHSNIKTKRTWAPNLQRVKLLVNGTPRRAYVCTRCLRSGKVQRAI